MVLLYTLGDRIVFIDLLLFRSNIGIIATPIVTKYLSFLFFVHIIPPPLFLSVEESSIAKWRKKGFAKSSYLAKPIDSICFCRRKFYKKF